MTPTGFDPPRCLQLRGLLRNEQTRLTSRVTKLKPESSLQIECIKFCASKFAPEDVLLSWVISFIQTLLQDAQHREAMDSLHLADRSSLMSEIHQLRGQLERVHHGESTGHSPIDKREGGGGDRGAESDRLLLEELKGELSQTRLELETTLKAQHKHLKEMDTLRLDEVWRVAITEGQRKCWSVGLIRKSQIFRQPFSLLLLPVSINPKLEYILTNLEISQ